MKKIITILAIIFALPMFFGCSEKVLEIKNPNALTVGDFWLTQEDVQAGVEACYNLFHAAGSWNRYLHWRFDLLSDEGYSMSPMVDAGNWTKFIYNNYNHNENQLYIYNVAYRTIFRANQVLTYADNVEFDSQDNKNKALGQAYFLRGYNYFHLAVLWEEVCIVNTIQNPGDKPEQATKEQVWAQVEDDLKKAAELLPGEWPASEKGRITKGAALAQLARAYLQQHKYQEAKDALEWLVNGEGKKYYGLVADPKWNFDVDHENNIESVFEVQMSDMFSDSNMTPQGETKTGSMGHQRAYIFGLKGVGARDGLVRPWVLEEFKKEKTIDGKWDPRLRVTIFYADLAEDFPDKETGLYYGYTWDQGYRNQGSWGTDIYFRKYSRDDWPTYYQKREDRTNPINIRVIRYADVLLMYAECLNELGNTASAYQYVDMVRARANLAPLATAYPEIGNDKAKFLARLQMERELELCGECVRWFDLKRWGLAETADGLKALQERDPDFLNYKQGVSYRQPLPSSEVLNNPNMHQLAGY